MNDLRLLLAFDHELSLGGTEDYARNLFDPSDRLLDLADELGVRVTLFTDVCCAIRFREWDHEGFFRPYRRQLESAVRRGHDVQLHLHPHWIDSHYVGGRFLPARSYSLAAFCHRPWPDNVAGIIARGVALLDEICRPLRADYRCLAYRAGGLDLGSADEVILPALYDQGIRIDSSIAKGYCYASDLWKVDHRNVPGRANWFLGTAGPDGKGPAGGLYEIPIATRPRTPINNLPFLLKRVAQRRRRYDCAGRPIDAGNTSLADKLRRLVPRSAWLLGFDNYTDTTGDLIRILRDHVKRHAGEERIACSSLSHPKYMGPYARGLMREFVERVGGDFGPSARFCTFREFHDETFAPDGTLDPTRMATGPKPR